MKHQKESKPKLVIIDMGLTLAEAILVEDIAKKAETHEIVLLTPDEAIEQELALSFAPIMPDAEIVKEMNSIEPIPLMPEPIFIDTPDHPFDKFINPSKIGNKKKWRDIR